MVVAYFEIIALTSLKWMGKGHHDFCPIHKDLQNSKGTSLLQNSLLQNQFQECCQSWSWSRVGKTAVLGALSGGGDDVVHCCTTYLLYDQ